MGSSVYLSAPPEFWYGMARLLDLGNTFDTYNEVSTGEQADSLGIIWDWEMVSQDLWEGICRYDLETNFAQKHPTEENQLVSQ
ncbi:MAG: hypothetical protein ACYDA9_05300 [Terriglobia bacterium]